MPDAITHAITHNAGKRSDFNALINSFFGVSGDRQSEHIRRGSEDSKQVSHIPRPHFRQSAAAASAGCCRQVMHTAAATGLMIAAALSFISLSEE
jgi:hypothetical protein